MNKVVREHYPLAKLPEDLQMDFQGQDEVTVTVEAVIPPDQAIEGPEPTLGRGTFSRFRHMAKSRYASSEDVVTHMRALREEWDEREQALNNIREH